MSYFIRVILLFIERQYLQQKETLFLINDRQITHDSGARLETKKYKSRE